MLVGKSEEKLLEGFRVYLALLRANIDVSINRWATNCLHKLRPIN
jgi:hypothetical protein